MKKIKILYILNLLGNGGTEKQLMLLVNELDRARFEPFIITIKDDWRDFTGHVSCDVRCFPIPKVFSMAGFRQMRAISSFARENNIDIVQAFFLDATIVGLFLKLTGAVKKVITARRDTGFWYTRSKLFILRLLNKYADTVLVNSEAVKKAVSTHEHAPEHTIRLIHNGVRVVSTEDITRYRHESRVRLDLKEDQLAVGILGNFNRQVKRYDLFIDAARIVREKYPTVIFILVGRGNLQAELDARIASYGIKDAFIFAGLQTEPVPWVCGFDIAINCSDTEGFSNAVLEYMMCCRPVVASAVQANKELIQDKENGFLFETGSADALAAKVMDLAADPALRQRLAHAGREDVIKKYSIDACLKKHAELYYEVLQKI